MASETFVSFGELAGSRIALNTTLEQACEVLDELPCKDFLSLLTFASQTRAAGVIPRQIIEGNNFHQPSSVNPRYLHETEGVILNTMEDLEFVDLSPLQPFGLNAVLGDVNQKTVVSTLRRSEVSADVGASLFRTALSRFKDTGAEVRLGANTRTVRAQKFDPVTKFLPHFKMFGQLTIDRQGEVLGQVELKSLVSHLASETNLLDEFSQHPNFDITKTFISVGNTVFVKDLVEQGLLDINELRVNTATPGYKPFETAGLDIPEYLDLQTPDLAILLADLGFKRGIKVVQKFKEQVERDNPALMPRLSLHLGRVAGMGYYKHICYKLESENSSGLVLPIGDGGSVDWATKVTGNRKHYTVISGVGTELLTQYFHI